MTGAVVGNTISDLAGCYAFSNPITVTRLGVNGGSLTTANGDTALTICAGDGMSDAFDVTLTGTEGDSSAWVITDANGEILGVPAGPPFDLEGAGAGICYVWHVSYNGALMGVAVGNNTSDLSGCFALSNPIIVTRNDPEGGSLATMAGDTALTICAGDGISDAFDVMLTGASGTNSGWIITDASGEILALPAAPPFDLEGAGAGVCLVWHISYADGLTGMMVGNNASDLTGCFELSNAITVTRLGVNGGELATTDGDTALTICAGDGVSDSFDITLNNIEGDSSAWVITDASGEILGVPAGPPFDLEGAGGGVCYVWHVSHNGALTGAVVGNNTSDLSGCFDLSNPIIVTRDTAGPLCISGVNDNELLRAISIYPTPTEDVLNVEVTNIQGEISMSVFNAAGVSVINNQLLERNGSNVTQLNVTQLPSGVYMVRFTNANRVATMQFVKM